jgi:hypothetical protein
MEKIINHTGALYRKIKINANFFSMQATVVANAFRSVNFAFD